MPADRCERSSNPRSRRRSPADFPAPSSPGPPLKKGPRDRRRTASANVS